MSQTAVSRSEGVARATLSHWEEAGLLPRFGSVPEDVYRDRVRLLRAARRVLSMQRIRAALATGGC